MTVWRIQNWGIRRQMLFVATAPVVLVLLILGYYVTKARIDDVAAFMRERGERTVEYLASASEFGLFSGNVEMLQALAEAVSTDTGVHSVRIYDANRKLLAQAPATAANAGTAEDEPLLEFAAAVRRSGVPVYDFEERFISDDAQAGRGTGPMIGWVVVKLSQQQVFARQQQILRNSALIIAAVLGLSAALAWRVGRGVSGPILRLNQMVTRLKQGDLNARVPVRSGGELGALEQTFNGMTGELQRAQNDLQAQVQEATEELRATVKALEEKNHELDLARREALQAGQEKAEFLAKMSHEIRTPLNAILGFTKLLGKTAQTQRQDGYTRTIEKAGAQLLCVIDDILNFSRLESGAVSLENITFNVRDCCEDVVCMLRPVAYEKKLELVLHIDPAVPESLHGDPARIGQVLTNLVNNAVKFTPAGSVTVEVSYHITAGEQGELDIAVVDTGIGIAKADQKKLFMPFSQADSSISRRFGGSGLGLVIAQRLVTLMAGQVGVVSEIGSGSKFWFRVPSRQAPAMSKPNPAKSLSGRNVLLYEANGSSRYALESQLRVMGGQVSVENEEIEQVVHRLAGQSAGRHYDLVVLGLGYDQQEPEVLKVIMGQVREVFAGPVLLLVNSEEYLSLPAVVQDRRVQWLAKPSRQRALATSVRELLAPATSFGREWRAEASDLERPSAPPVSVGAAGSAVATNAYSANAGSGQLPSQAVAESSVPEQLWEQVMSDLLQRAQSLPAALARGDWVEFEEHTQKLHGLACYLGIDELAFFAKKLEQSLHEGRRAEIEACLDLVDRRIRQITNAGVPV